MYFELCMYGMREKDKVYLKNKKCVVYITHVETRDFLFFL